MSVSVVINGAKRVTVGAERLLLIDLTIGTSHQHIPFNEQQLLGVGSTADMITYITTQALKSVSATTMVTTVPTGFPDIRSTTTLTGGVPMAAFGTTKRTTTTTPDTFAATDAVIYVNATGGNKVLNLPTAVGVDGQRYEAKKTDSSANTVTVTPNGAETIDGAATLVLTKTGQTVVLTSDGANWQSTRSIGNPQTLQTGASAAGLAAISDANAKAALTALQNALANMGLVSSPG